MSVESIKKYLSGKKNINMDILRNKNEVLVTRRIMLKNIDFYFRDFRADVYIVDLDYHKGTPITHEISLGKVSVKVGGNDSLVDVRNKIIKKFPTIASSMKDDKTNTIKEEVEKKIDNSLKIKRSVLKASKERNIKLDKQLISHLGNLIKEYGNNLKVPTVSFSEKGGYIVMSFRWVNDRQSFTLSVNSNPEDDNLWGRSIIFFNGSSVKDFVSPFFFMSSMREVAPISYALGTQILEKQKSEISLKPLLTNDLMDMSPKRKPRVRRK